MPKILVNYKHNKKTDTYTVLENNVVYADMPIAVMDMYAEYNDILVVPLNNVMTVVDKEEYTKINKQFKLTAYPDGTVKEDSQNGTPIWLPKDTDINMLRVVNGQLVMIEPEKEVPEDAEIKEGE